MKAVITGTVSPIELEKFIKDTLIKWINEKIEDEANFVVKITMFDRDKRSGTNISFDSIDKVKEEDE